MGEAGLPQLLPVFLNPRTNLSSYTRDHQNSMSTLGQQAMVDFKYPSHKKVISGSAGDNDNNHHHSTVAP